MHKFLLIFTLIFTSFNSIAQIKSKAWTSEYKKEVIDLYYKEFNKDNSFHDANEIKIFINCIVNKLEILLPNGLSSMSTDSLYKINFKLGRECAALVKNPHVTIKWTDAGEAEFKKKFFEGEMSKIDPKISNQLYECALLKLKKIYPTQVELPINNSVLEKIINDCINLLKEK